MTSQVKLTEYSHGAGCGCKIAPSILESILHGQVEFSMDKHLLVGNESKDDAAVYDIGNGEAIVSTTDFFMPIVDDPFTFGQIAATNALSDIYAMGASPMMAIAILGWPISKLGADVAGRVVDGGRQACKDAGIILAGGHSIDAPEPIFGLAATGRVKIANLKQNNQAKVGSILYLTKALGVGILSTAQKQKVLKPEHSDVAINSMSKLNTIGEQLGQLAAVTAMTDVTGFGLLGHLLEICQGSNVAAQLNFEQVPLLDPAVEKYRKLGCIPGGGQRNFTSYGQHVSELTEQQQQILCDPQTSGGLLVAVMPDAVEEFLRVAPHAYEIGEIAPKSNGHWINVS
ncbi:MAG: selenide, water dikinase SelD [Gammaproteobacteria bacterium]|nr:selenide, water dikinase SelD [Gammaproteobacteria bacterium]